MEKNIEINYENPTLAQTHSIGRENYNFDETLCVKEDNMSVQSSGSIDETSENRTIVKTEPVDISFVKHEILQDDKDAETRKALVNNLNDTHVISAGKSVSKDEIRTQNNSLEKPEHICSGCEKRFPCHNKLRDHMCCHLDRKFFCDICNKGFTSCDHLLRHNRQVHSEHGEHKPFQCTICSKRLSSMASLRCHMNSSIHSKGKKYLCKLCGKGYNTDYSWKIHLLEHKGERAFSCGECDMKFLSQRQLKRHMICHISERPHKCKSCGKPFKTRADLRAHELFVHDSAEICKICNKSVRYISKHMKRVHREKPSFVCGECKKEFPRRKELVDHVARHKKTGRYLSCSFCYKMCFTQAQLDQHVTTHPSWRKMRILRKSLREIRYLEEKDPKPTQSTSVDQYKDGFCIICEKSLDSNSTLSVHMRSRHPGQKPFKCDLCEEAFVVHQYLKIHLDMKH